MNRKILIIEDDQIILKFLTLALKTHDYEPIKAENGAIGMNYFLSHCPDLVILDLGLPDIEGREIITNIRKINQTPIIVISARGREADKVDALDSGADDYITKPFNIGEVLARIRVVFRKNRIMQEKKTFEYEHLKIDFEKHRVFVDETVVHFTPIEFKLLELLVENQGKVLTHSFIQSKVWGYHTDDEYKSLRVFMTSIRKKIEKHDRNPLIRTEIGVGYRLRDE